MKVRFFDSLPDAARQIRVSVFVKEQGFSEEFDALDNVCVHAVMMDGDLPIATCRLWQENKAWHIGRLAVIRSYRGLGLGQAMLEASEAHVRSVGGHSVTLHAQVRAKEFYEKCGYRAFGDIDYDEGVAHVYMKKDLNTETEC